MKSSFKIPIEMAGCFTDDKTGFFNNPCFKWNVRLNYIPQNFPFALAEQGSTNPIYSNEVLRLPLQSEITQLNLGVSNDFG